MVTPDGDTEDVEFPSVLLVSWVIIGALFFSLGVVCSTCCRVQEGPTHSPQHRWEKLARKAINFVNKRRRVSLAFSAYKGNTLRNNEGSRPSQARKALRPRALTPTPGRLLNEGPAVVRARHGPHG